MACFLAAKIKEESNLGIRYSLLPSPGKHTASENFSMRLCESKQGLHQPRALRGHAVNKARKDDAAGTLNVVVETYAAVDSTHYLEASFKTQTLDISFSALYTLTQLNSKTLDEINISRDLNLKDILDHTRIFKIVVETLSKNSSN